MTQITINIDNPQDASLIKKILRKFDSVTFETKRKEKSSYQQACDEIAHSEPNHKTIAAIEEAKAGKLQGPLDLTSIEAMYKSMGL